MFEYQSATNSWEQQQKLVPYPDGAASDGFGERVGSVGQMAVVAAPGRNSSQGAVDLFAFDAGHSAWIKQGSLQGPDGPGGYFGNSLALSSNLLAVGSLGKTDANNVYLYTTAGGTATFQSRLPSDGQQAISGSFGESIAWSRGELLVSAPYATIDSSDRGLVHAFLPTDSSWVERQPVEAVGDGGEYFGISMAVAGDVAVVRATHQTDYYGNQGAADVYSRDVNGNWSWEQKLSDNFAGAIAIDGNTLLIGAPGQAFGDNYNQGAAYIYAKSENTWTEQAEIADLVAGKAGDGLGASVALCGDTALISAPGINGNTGGAFVYVKSGTTWIKQATLIVPGAAAGDITAQVVALRGNTALISGSFFADDGGSVYVFQRTGTTWNEKKKLVASDGVAGDDFGRAIAISDKAALVGSDQKRVGANYGQGRVYIFSGSDWSSELTIDSASGVNYGHFGSSLAIDSNRLIIGESGQNSVYIFYSDQGNWSLQSSLINVANSYFGTSVAASNGTVLVGAPNDGNGSNHGGRAYIFQDDRIFADDFD